MVDGHGWRREGKVGEGACGHGDDAGDSVDAPGHGGAATRTKAICDVTAIVAYTNEFGGVPFNPHVFIPKPGAETECAARFSLTGQTVADG